MKLYTEEQMILAFAYGKTLEPFDCFEDMIDSLTHIELPSEEEIAKNAYIWCREPDENNLINTGDDYDTHELPAFIAGAQWVINHIKQQVIS
jgi:hypothetical protein